MFRVLIIIIFSSSAFSDQEIVEAVEEIKRDTGKVEYHHPDHYDSTNVEILEKDTLDLSSYYNIHFLSNCCQHKLNIPYIFSLLPEILYIL